MSWQGKPESSPSCLGTAALWYNNSKLTTKLFKCKQDTLHDWVHFLHCIITPRRFPLNVYVVVTSVVKSLVRLYMTTWPDRICKINFYWIQYHEYTAAILWVDEAVPNWAFFSELFRLKIWNSVTTSDFSWHRKSWTARQRLSCRRKLALPQ